MKALHILYSAWLALLFVILFFILFPFLLIPIIDKRRYKWTSVINRIWARLLFTLSGLPVHLVYRQPLDKNKKYVFCANHFSYLDIPTMGLLRENVVFVGKHAMERIPLFGWMYRRLHITVNRSSLRSRYNTILRCYEAIDQGKSLVIFPEGGIISENPPLMARFKDGPFRIAIEKQIDVVPVGIINNWKILPEDLLLRWFPLRVVVGQPISVEGLTLDDVAILREKTFQAIQNEI